jgi:dihydrodipicolinate synthase/N-acetylneuraminate lyase
MSASAGSSRRGELRGALAASATPLRDGGASLDEGAIGPIVDFLAAGGVSGLLALGTTGEGILFDVEERKRATERFIEAAAGRLAVAAHCGAQTTADTAELAAHAAEAGADAVAVIGPPYFAFDDRSLLEHFAAAAAACAPLPFYLYEFAARSGYQVPRPVIDQLRERSPNLTGLKVSDTPWERFEPYLLEGLDVLVGPEALIHRGLEGGAVGAVSGLAAAFPEIVARVVADPTEEGAAAAGQLRASVNTFPFHAAIKHVLALRGVPVEPDVRAPLRALDDGERAELEQVVEAALATV